MANRSQEGKSLLSPREKAVQSEEGIPSFSAPTRLVTISFSIEDVWMNLHEEFATALVLYHAEKER